MAVKLTGTLFSSHPLILGGWSISAVPFARAAGPAIQNSNSLAFQSRSIRLGCASFIQSFLSRPPINNVGEPGIRGRPNGAFSKVASSEYLDQIDHGHGHELQSPAEAVLHRLGTNRTPTHWACISTHRPSASSIMPSLGMELEKAPPRLADGPRMIETEERRVMEWNILYDLNPQSGPSTLLYTPVVFLISQCHILPPS
ncbi:hypothetical protein ASPFODRAFT_37854 [Aspergillus luchuensis CBS 106.47]|uniref:Uncharacterized protein n=1 Tax=Aspergillus luchuensis (strain CBS 106.47) TaxID=1137211 RepID=A0A1M3T2I5_ASPLC|nr:hypothetical protein ASPFODRAFT_37854 [Aspergillus luchuensis CBS 106.47]